MKFAAMNINFDSLGEAYGFPQNYRDPSFFEASERFFEVADQYGFKYTLFIIGRDLEKPENRELVKEWHRRGHEIGSHSWNHYLNLGALSRAEIYEEVSRAHNIIGETIGEAPRGFISPNWSTSRNLLEVLIQHNYIYDTSAHPSWLMLPATMKMVLNHLGHKKALNLLDRRDWLAMMTGSRAPFVSSGSLFPTKSKSTSRIMQPGKEILVMPVPSNRLRIAFWHTLAFSFDRPTYNSLLNLCLRDTEIFYYLMHPGDILDTNDLDPNMTHHLERLDVPLAQKREMLDTAVQTLLADKRKLVTMRELADIALFKMGRSLPDQAVPYIQEREAIGAGGR